ncbi:MAG: hemolysin III family protein [Ignavibacteriales bacterium]|nr:MAG: hemolysin III family protein [Ignavibacteriales bacterium]
MNNLYVKSLNKRFRNPFSGLSHLFAAIASFIGLLVLIIPNLNNDVKLLSLLVYGISLVLLFSFSAAYHLTIAEPEKILALRKLDHSAIFIQIAGTYTPLCLNLFTGFWKYGLLTIIWLFALIGIVLKMYFIHAPRWVSAGIYLVMGWLALLGLSEIISVMSNEALIWLALGGLFFTVGAVIYSFKLMNFIPDVFGFHEVWHLFVILGCLSHYILILRFVALS